MYFNSIDLKVINKMYLTLFPVVSIGNDALWVISCNTSDVKKTDCFPIYTIHVSFLHEMCLSRN